MGMFEKLLAKLTYANVTATLALVLALGGGATAVALSGKNTVTSDDIKANAVKSSDIKDGGVTPADLAPSAIGSQQIAPASVGSEEIADGSVGTADVGDSSIGLAKLTPSDLTVSVSGPEAVVSGNNPIRATYTVTVTNNGSGAASPSVIVGLIGPDSVFSPANFSAAATDGRCVPLDEFQLGCSAGPLAAGESAALNVVVERNRTCVGGVLTFRVNALVMGSPRDTVPTNDTATKASSIASDGCG